MTLWSNSCVNNNEIFWLCCAIKTRLVEFGCNVLTFKLFTSWQNKDVKNIVLTYFVSCRVYGTTLFALLLGLPHCTLTGRTTVLRHRESSSNNPSIRRNPHVCHRYTWRSAVTGYATQKRFHDTAIFELCYNGRNMSATAGPLPEGPTYNWAL
jgi:hypothetical protein